MTDEEREAEELVDDLNAYLYEMLRAVQRRAREDVQEVMLKAYYRYIRPYERLRGFSFVAGETAMYLPSAHENNETSEDLDQVVSHLSELEAMTLLLSERGSKARLHTLDLALLMDLRRYVEVNTVSVLAQALAGKEKT